MAEINFDPNAQEARQSFDVLPPSEQPAVITESSMEPTSKGGAMLKLTFEIIDGQFKGRKIWENLNLINNNPKAVDIARGTLTSICNAVGIRHHIKDSQELHNKPMILKLDVKTDVEKDGAGNIVKTYEPKNVIKDYKSYGNGAPVQQPAQQYAQAQPAQQYQGGQQAATSAPQQPAVNGAAPPPWTKK
jgi:hypothetical protein